MTDFMQVITTVAQEEDAQHIAQALVAAQLAGCVQIIGPITSTYRWQGDIETAQEWLCLIKTSRALYAQVETTIHAQHPYETPEILAVPVIAGSTDYLAWLGAQLQPPET